MNVHIVCRAPKTRILERLANKLSVSLGWSISEVQDKEADINYAFPYFELRHFDKKFIALFTHREDTRQDKVKIWYEQAKRADLRIVFCKLYEKELKEFGRTARITPPLDRDLFCIANKKKNSKPVIGVSGFVYGDGRKGEYFIRELLKDDIAKEFIWKASGRGWPITDTRMYKYDELPAFYQSLDIFLCTSLIEGVPYPPLEAMACGVRCVIPKGVGLLDELPDIPDLIRYEKGNLEILKEALKKALNMGEPNRNELRQITSKFTSEAWVNGHLEAISSLENNRSYWIFENKKESNKGVFIVAYGEPARNCAKQCIESIKMTNPDLPIALCSNKELGIEDYFCYFPDLDLGARQAKINSFWTSPKEWKYVLYLDSDVVVRGNLSFLFYCLEKGWDLVASKDIHLQGYHLISNLFERDIEEGRIGRIELKTDKLLAVAGGVIGFKRNKRVEKFFKSWLEEWKVLGRRDQGALLRALIKNPLKIYLLSNHWNCLKISNFSLTDEIISHYQTRARRWRGNYPIRLDFKHSKSIAIKDDELGANFEMIAIKSFMHFKEMVKKDSKFIAKGWLAKKLVKDNIAIAIKKVEPGLEEYKCIGG